jgi:hypothetical protein
MGKHANYLNGMTSWRLAVTLALGQNTVLATLKHAGIPMEPQAPSTEAAATPIDTFDGSSITFTTSSAQAARHPRGGLASPN